MKYKWIVLLIICLMLLTGCECKHKWVDATCDTPKSCSKCGETEGSPLGHTWQAPTCTKPRNCTTCGKVNGEANGHDWNEATCTEPRCCNDCGKIDGDSLGHNWESATCIEAETCSRCEETRGNALGHNLQGSKCSRCNMTTCEIEGHIPGDWEVLIEATALDSGMEVQRCSVCSEAIDKRDYDLKSFCKDGRFGFSPYDYAMRLKKLCGETIVASRMEVQLLASATGSMALVVNYSGSQEASMVFYANDHVLTEDDCFVEGVNIMLGKLKFNSTESASFVMTCIIWACDPLLTFSDASDIVVQLTASYLNDDGAGSVVHNGICYVLSDDGKEGILGITVPG